MHEVRFVARRSWNRDPGSVLCAVSDGVSSTVYSTPAHPRSRTTPGRFLRGCAQDTRLTRWSNGSTAMYPRVRARSTVVHPISAIGGCHTFCKTKNSVVTRTDININSHHASGAKSRCHSSVAEGDANGSRTQEAHRIYLFVRTRGK